MTPAKREQMYETAWRWALTLIGSLMLAGIGWVLTGQNDIRKSIDSASAERIQHESRIKALEVWGPLAGERVTAKDLASIQSSMLQISTQLSDMREAVGRIDERTSRP